MYAFFKFNGFLNIVVHIKNNVNKKLENFDLKNNTTFSRESSSYGSFRSALEPNIN